jgi:hypothetical protein
MEPAKIENYVITPRYIAADYRNGQLTIPERNLLLWLRVNGSPYGIAIVDMASYARETFNTPVDKSYINKLLLSLKSKRYVWYSDRSGRRGSFEVHMGDWILPSKHIKTLDKYFDDGGVRGKELMEKYGKTEVDTEVETLSQSFEVKNTLEKPSDSFKAIGELVRGYDNDNNKEKDNDKESLQSLSFKKRDCSFSKFKENSYEDMQCKKIALATGDKDVAFCIGIYRKYGLGVLERAFTEFDESKGLSKDNPPAFFNSLVQAQL